MTTVAVLGTGNMAGAIAKRLADADPTVHQRLTTRTRVPEWASGLSHVEHRALAQDAGATRWAVEDADVVIVGVKPAQVRDLLTEVGPMLAEGALVLSVAAGIRLESMRAALPAHVRLVRSMPNTPTAIGRGVTAIAIETDADSAVAREAAELLAPTGLVEVLPEASIDAFSSVCGSGPAYAYYFVEALEAAAADLGLDDDLAQRVVPAMLAGSLAYLGEAGQCPAQLRRQVTSPGGSTAKAIETFEAEDLQGTVVRALRAAFARNADMGA
ncbi:pyrroline-5-carboxylate reductase [Demequina globuliformis]|uniref:pyrroline-5-carboxylate reductase n=1 Tax=Demequina globuliformis TaxID=676202 RepID=UPI00078447F8|nr:pyrroline-5-carboxylate reductase [Demequina globuliformis]